MIRSFMITCEHAVNDVPENYRHLFSERKDILYSHRAWDPGAWDVACRLAVLAGAPIMMASCSRLIVDLNREESSPEVFSEFTRDLPEEERKQLIKQYHRRFRGNAEDMVEIARQRANPLVHLSVHSFTPELNGEARDCDISLLYDPDRPREVRFCDEYIQQMESLAPSLRIRRNYPYKGTDDGLTRWLRERFSPEHYIGIEVELNHGPFLAESPKWREISDTVVFGLRRILEKP